MIDTNALRQINHIIEHDSKSSTYKYVLLKSTINACQKYEHLIISSGSNVSIPLGLIIEEWILNYMPFVFKNISQQNNSGVFDKIIETAYSDIFIYLALNKSQDWEYAYMQFMKAYDSSFSTPELSKLFLHLSKKIAHKIVDMPMRYIGKTEYELFIPNIRLFGSIKLDKSQLFNSAFLVNSFGYFSISKEHYDVFRYLGQSLYGTSTIMKKWQDKTARLNPNNSHLKDIIEKLSVENIVERNTSPIRKILPDINECVWSGKELKNSSYDVDHVLPYSVWFNNDIWNLLPSDKKVNNTKSDKIPSIKLIEKRADIIKYYWQFYHQRFGDLFSNQINVSLTGVSSNYNTLYDDAIESLCKKCNYLIYDRGHESFDI